MKNKFKKIGVGYLFTITLLLLSNSCTNLSNKPSNQKIIRDYYVTHEKKDWNMLTSLVARILEHGVY